MSSSEFAVAGFGLSDVVGYLTALHEMETRTPEGLQALACEMIGMAEATAADKFLACCKIRPLVIRSEDQDMLPEFAELVAMLAIEAATLTLGPRDAELEGLKLELAAREQVIEGLRSQVQKLETKLRLQEEVLEVQAMEIEEGKTGAVPNVLAEVAPEPATIRRSALAAPAVASFREMQFSDA